MHPDSILQPLTKPYWSVARVRGFVRDEGDHEYYPMIYRTSNGDTPTVSVVHSFMGIHEYC